MSQFKATSNNTTGFGGERQPLSGAQNAQPAPDYSTDISERADDQTMGFGQGQTTRSNRGQTTGSGDTQATGFDGQTTGIDQGDRFENRHENRDPKRVQGFQPEYDIDGQPNDSSQTRYQPTQAGGAAQGNYDDFQQHGKASMTDKVVGKAQEMTGKLTNNPEKREMGEVRGNSGKAAAHDFGDSRTSSTKF